MAYAMRASACPCLCVYHQMDEFPNVTLDTFCVMAVTIRLYLGLIFSMEENTFVLAMNGRIYNTQAAFVVMTSCVRM